jgi:hypothetical protein
VGAFGNDVRRSGWHSNFISTKANRNPRSVDSVSGGFSDTKPQSNSPENIDDVMLMESVNAHLSRPIPMSMERVMALLPVEIEQPGSPGGFEGKESR